MVAPIASSPLIYFHGLPGGSEEWGACAPPGLTAFAPDRNIPVDAATLAEQIDAKCADSPVTLIGFSLGAPIALNVARILGERARHIHLVSPAAPLHLGDFVDAMAGGPLFHLAASRPTLFRMIARIEGVIAHRAPDFLFGRLFASAVGDDVSLSRNPAFRTAIAQVLSSGLGRDWRGFAGEVAAYVTDWRPALAQVKAPVTIWQGEADNWTPPAMAEALAAALPGPVALNLLPGCSHYSTLRAALAQLS